MTHLEIILARFFYEKYACSGSRKTMILYLDPSITPENFCDEKMLWGFRVPVARAVISLIMENFQPLESTYILKIALMDYRRKKLYRI